MKFKIIPAEHVEENFRNVITNKDVDPKWNLNDHYKMLKIL